jgi:hypothetical protein
MANKFRFENSDVEILIKNPDDKKPTHNERKRPVDPSIRSERIYIRVSIREKEAIVRKGKESKYDSVSEFIRKTILGDDFHE